MPDHNGCKLTECGNWNTKDGCSIGSTKSSENQFACDDFIDRNEHQVFIEVSGGMVQRVFSTATDDYIHIKVIDVDGEKAKSPEAADAVTQQVDLVAETYHQVYYN